MKKSNLTFKEFDFTKSKRISIREKYILEMRNIEVNIAISIGTNGFEPAYFWVKNINDIERLNKEVTRIKKCLISPIVFNNADLRYIYTHQLREIINLINR
jgi:hypothetical protein